jgi:dGTPase
MSKLRDPIDPEFRKRRLAADPARVDDDRDEYQRDRARIVHSAAFRRLQAKTQVMGVGEGDFHRTRLTHSLEAGQIGEGILARLNERHKDDAIRVWLPSRELVQAACFAHDIGHPPFGHGGEKALHARMVGSGGFEGNGQTLRIVARLEKSRRGFGINPTRRTVLALLKYPMPYSKFCATERRDHPPKCYFDAETDIVQWAIEPFNAADQARFMNGDIDDEKKPKHRTLDCSLMECADDIAYAVHDLEDIVARRLVKETDIEVQIKAAFAGARDGIGPAGLKLENVLDGLFTAGDDRSYRRKQTIGDLVNLFISTAAIVKDPSFEHPLLNNRVGFPKDVEVLLKSLKKATFRLVIRQAEVQQLERRGKWIIEQLFDAFMAQPELIPEDAWNSLEPGDTDIRRVCDYVAGMTDSFAERIYRRMFVPGFGSSRDDL